MSAANAVSGSGAAPQTNWITPKRVVIGIALAAIATLGTLAALNLTGTLTWGKTATIAIGSTGIASALILLVLGYT